MIENIIKLTIILISIFALSFYFLNKGKRENNNRMLQVILILIISHNIVDLATPTNNYSDAYNAIFYLSQIGTIFLLSNEFIFRKKTNKFLIHIIYLPTLIFILATTHSYFYSDYINLNIKNFQLIFIVTALIITSIFLISTTVNKLKYLNIKHINHNIITILVFVIQSAWMYFLLWIILFIKMNHSIISVSNQHFLSAIEVIIAITAYFHLFRAYKRELISISSKKNPFAQENLILIDEDFKQKDSKGEIKSQVDYNNADKNIDYTKIILSFFETNKEEYLQPDFTISKLGDILKVSKYHIQKVIQDEHNISFTQYLNELRIAYAIGLLNEGDTISNISKKCGYKSRTSFYYNFEKVMNISISDYKSQVMGSQKDAEL